MSPQEIAEAWQSLLERGCTVSVDEHDTDEVSHCEIRELSSGRKFEGKAVRWQDAFEIAYAKYKAAH